MRFIIVDAHKCEIREANASDLTDTYPEAGLERGSVDHGTIRRGFSIVVKDYGLFDDPDKVPYFALAGALYSGNAVIFAYDQAGETVDIDWKTGELANFIQWFSSRTEIERAIAAKTVVRPTAAINGVVHWTWPEQNRDWGKGAIEADPNQIIDMGDVVIIPLP